MAHREPRQLDEGHAIVGLRAQHGAGLRQEVGAALRGLGARPRLVLGGLGGEACRLLTREKMAAISSSRSPWLR